jgi:hypothetical protein
MSSEIEEIIANVFEFDTDTPITYTHQTTGDWITKLDKKEIEEIVANVFKLDTTSISFIDQLDAVVAEVSSLNKLQRDRLIADSPEVTADWLIELDADASTIWTDELDAVVYEVLTFGSAKTTTSINWTV